MLFMTAALIVFSMPAFGTGETADIVMPGVMAEKFDGFVVPAAENEGVYTDQRAFYKDGVYVLFLPCRADVSELTYYAVDKECNYLERFKTDFSQGAAEILGNPVVCMQSDLPSLEIVTNEDYGSFEEVIKDSRHETYAYGEGFLSLTDTLSRKKGVNPVFIARDLDKSEPCSVSIKGRGNITWLEDKKPFRIKLESKVSLLNMPEGKKWVLLPNVIDHSLLRNDTFLTLGREMGIDFTPQSEPVDLFINGEYWGNYSLCSKVEISKSRVAIDPEQDYFYRIGIKSGNCRSLGSEHIVKTDDYVELLNGYGDERDNAAFNLAIDFMKQIEDENSSLTLLDAESLAKYYWLQEFSKNTDAALRSVYFYYSHVDGKMHFAAPWDFDRTAGTVDRFTEEDEPSVRGAVEEAEYLYPVGYCVRNRDWYIPLFEHKDFAKLVDAVYVRDGLSELFGRTFSNIPMRASYIERSAYMNFTRWDYLERPLDGYYNVIEKYMGDTSFKSEVTWLTEWLRQRTEFFDEDIKNKTGVK